MRGASGAGREIEQGLGGSSKLSQSFLEIEWIKHEPDIIRTKQPKIIFKCFEKLISGIKKSFRKASNGLMAGSRLL